MLHVKKTMVPKWPGVLVFGKSLEFQGIWAEFNAGGGPNKTHVGNKVTALGRNTED